MNTKEDFKDLLTIDEKTLDAILECKEKEKDFREKSFKKPKRKKNNFKLFERLMVEDLIKKGYIQ